MFLCVPTAGPKEDIVVSVTGDDGEPQSTGFLATDATEYADAITQVGMRPRCLGPHTHTHTHTGFYAGPVRAYTLFLFCS